MRRHPFSDRLRGITREIVATYGASRETASHIDPERRLPSRSVVVSILQNLFAVLYPGFYGVQHLTQENVEYHVGALLDDIAADLYEQAVLAYEFERASDKATRAQQVRLPAATFRDNAGTCIDLTVLYLSCLAAAKLWPVFVCVRKYTSPSSSSPNE